MNPIRSINLYNSFDFLSKKFRQNIIKIRLTVVFETIFGFIVTAFFTYKIRNLKGENRKTKENEVCYD